MDGMPCWADLTAGAGPGFYAAVLGWSFTTDDVAAHHEAVALAGGRRLAGLGGPEGAPPGWTVYFAVEDAADAAEATEEAGGQVLHGPDDDGRGGLVVVAMDAGGAPFGLWESDEADSPPAWVEAATAEPGTTRTFYASVLGHEHRPTDEPGTTTLHVDGGPAFGAVALAGDALPHWLVHFAVDDVDAAVAAAEAAGGVVVAKDARHAVLEDPAGARFAVSG